MKFITTRGSGDGGDTKSGIDGLAIRGGASVPTGRFQPMAVGVRTAANAATGTNQRLIPLPDIAHHIKRTILLLCASTDIPDSAVSVIRINACNRCNICSIGIERIARAVAAGIVGRLIPFIFGRQKIDCSVCCLGRSAVYTQKVTSICIITAEQIWALAFVTAGQVVAELQRFIPAYTSGRLLGTGVI